MLGCLQVVLENPVEELHELLVTLLLGVLNIALERFGVLRGLIECAYQVVVLIFGLSRCVGHLVSFRRGIHQISCIPKTGFALKAALKGKSSRRRATRTSPKARATPRTPRWESPRRKDDTRREARVGPQSC